MTDLDIYLEGLRESACGRRPRGKGLRDGKGPHRRGRQEEGIMEGVALTPKVIQSKQFAQNIARKLNGKVVQDFAGADGARLIIQFADGRLFLNLYPKRMRKGGKPVTGYEALVAWGQQDPKAPEWGYHGAAKKGKRFSVNNLDDLMKTAKTYMRNISKHKPGPLRQG